MPPFPSIITRVTPWTSWKQWDQVRTGLFASELSKKKQALDQVKIWKLRGEIPFAIDVTASICEIQINSALIDSTHLTRLAISMVIVRFVNGMVDQLQRSRSAYPVHVLASELGIPLWVVDLRHAATHESLPEMDVLRDACDEIMSWCVENYWDEQSSLLTKISEDIARVLSEYVVIVKKSPRSAVCGVKLNAIISQVAIPTWGDLLAPHLFVTSSDHSLLPSSCPNSSFDDLEFVPKFISDWNPLFEAASENNSFAVSCLRHCFVSFIDCIHRNVVDEDNNGEKEEEVPDWMFKVLERWIVHFILSYSFPKSALRGILCFAVVNSFSLNSRSFSLIVPLVEILAAKVVPDDEYASLQAIVKDFHGGDGDGGGFNVKNDLDMHEIESLVFSESRRREMRVGRKWEVSSCISCIDDDDVLDCADSTNVNNEDCDNVVESIVTNVMESASKFEAYQNQL